MSVGVGEFVDHAGLRHGLNYAGKPRCGARMVWSNLPTVGDCRECFPESYGPSPDFSSSTLTDLQKLTDERDQARDIAVRLEQENARMVDALHLISRYGCESYVAPHNCRTMGQVRGAKYGADAWCEACIALDALAAAPAAEPACSTCRQPMDAPPCCTTADGKGSHTVEGGCSVAPVDGAE